MSVVNTKLPLPRPIQYSGPYKPYFSYDRKTDVTRINKAISQLVINEKVNFFNSTLMNIFVK